MTDFFGERRSRPSPREADDVQLPVRDPHNQVYAPVIEAAKLPDASTNEVME